MTSRLPPISPAGRERSQIRSAPSPWPVTRWPRSSSAIWNSSSELRARSTACQGSPSCSRTHKLRWQAIAVAAPSRENAPIHA
ncbi:MAG TPA: hypothetical protein VHW23_20265 [Kofleriaceae bacterium]|nr:hypothetical protein [Kofleriaceae bacterium]